MPLYHNKVKVLHTKNPSIRKLEYDQNREGMAFLKIIVGSVVNCRHKVVFPGDEE